MPSGPGAPCGSGGTHPVGAPIPSQLLRSDWPNPAAASVMKNARNKGLWSALILDESGFMTEVLLERDENEYFAAAFFKTGHGFAQNRALCLLMIGGFHAMARDARTGEQIARLDRAARGVGQCINPAGQGDV